MKYYIIPKVDIAMEINADIMNCNNKADAMTIFAINMDSDMNQYFKAVTEEEYENMKNDKDFGTYKRTVIDFMRDVALDNFYIPEADANDVAYDAYEKFCEGKESLTQYECVNIVCNQYWEEHDDGEDDEDEDEDDEE